MPQPRWPMPSSGFTIIEAVATIGILLIMSGLVMTGVIGARRGSAVRAAAQQFAGHLHEAGSLAQNGVKDPQCVIDVQTAAALTDAERRTQNANCSRYEVTFTAGGAQYTRRTVAIDLGGGVTQRYSQLVGELPGGAVFHTGDGGTPPTFRYVPPVLTVTNSGSYGLRHVTDSAPQVCVEVGQLGFVEVRQPPC